MLTGSVSSDQLLSAFYRNARAQFGYRMGEGVTFSSHWTPDGARVPLVIEGRSLLAPIGALL